MTVLALSARTKPTQLLTPFDTEIRNRLALIIDVLPASPMTSMTLKAHQFQQEWQLKALMEQGLLA
jgi:hypothetical protein